MDGDLVARLRRFHSEVVSADGAESGQMRMMREAANEIERLRAEVAAAREAGAKDMLRRLRDGINWPEDAKAETIIELANRLEAALSDHREVKP